MIECPTCHNIVDYLTIDTCPACHMRGRRAGGEEMSLELEAEARRLAPTHGDVCRYRLRSGACDCGTSRLEAEILALLQKVAHAGWLRGKQEADDAFERNETTKALRLIFLREAREIMLAAIDAAIAKGEGK